MAINKAIFEGRLTANPEPRKTDSGKSVCLFRVAVDDSYKDAKKAYFFDIVAWEKTAEFVTQYGRKGARVIIDAKPTQRQFTDKTGNNRSVVEFVAQNVSLIDWPEKKADPLDDFDEIKINEPLPF